MDLQALGAGNLAMGLIEQMTGLASQQVRSEAGFAVMRNIMDAQKVLAAELFRSLGVGTRLDVRG